MVAGVGSEVEEGGSTYRVGLKWPCAAQIAHFFFFFFFLRAYNAQHNSLGRSVGMVPLGRFLNLDHTRVLLRPSETTIITQNLWQLRRLVVSRSPPSCKRAYDDVIFMRFWARHCHRTVGWAMQI